jgi:hypothetical protein
MKFEKLVKSLLEGFNIYPKSQVAPNAGPDIGMTSGDMQNTFPSKMETIEFKIKRKTKKKPKKD